VSIIYGKGMKSREFPKRMVLWVVGGLHTKSVAKTGKFEEEESAT